MTIAHVHIPLMSDEAMEAMRKALVDGACFTRTTIDREFAEISRKPPPFIADHAAFAFEETWKKVSEKPGEMVFVSALPPVYEIWDPREISADDRAVHTAIRFGHNDDKRYGVAQYVGEGE